MSNDNLKLSTVTAILPRKALTEVSQAVTQTAGSSALLWDARGTLLREHWYDSLLPSISPAKEMLQLLVPDYEVPRVVSTIVEVGKLHLQSTGAVFCTGCDDVYFGSEFHRWPDDDQEHPEAPHNLRENLDVIYCIVEPNRTEAIARAAIRAGAHGPVVYLGEGRGLRDRLGWLRITKQQTKEVITVLTDSSDAGEVFTAMAKAGQVHLPGRGFMYRMPVATGMFNLPSRVSHHHHAASMQQMINAIDHISGHSHWRDQEVFSMGGDVKVAGIDFLSDQAEKEAETLLALSGFVLRDQSDQLIDILLDSGAAGVNVSFARFVAEDELCVLAGAKINVEYALLRCIATESEIGKIRGQVCEKAAAAGINDIAVFTQPVGEVATYIRGVKENRAA